MAIEYGTESASLCETVSVQEAEGLLSWLQGHPEGRLDLEACTHMHPANLQVMMAAKVTVTAWPTDAKLAAWLRSALKV